MWSGAAKQGPSFSGASLGVTAFKAAVSTRLPSPSLSAMLGNNGGKILAGSGVDDRERGGRGQGGGEGRRPAPSVMHDALGGVVRARCSDLTGALVSYTLLLVCGLVLFAPISNLDNHTHPLTHPHIYIHTYIHTYTHTTNE